jgi:large subunit ribosomal protein L18e
LALVGRHILLAKLMVINKMKSNTKIEKQTQRKTNPELVETIRLAKKNKAWVEIAHVLCSPRKNKVEINLNKINEEAKAGEIIVVPGKILSLGEINKKLKVAALNFSEKAKEKLLKAGCDVLSISDEIKKNPEMKGVKIIK